MSGSGGGHHHGVYPRLVYLVYAFGILTIIIYLWSKTHLHYISYQATTTITTADWVTAVLAASPAR